MEDQPEKIDWDNSLDDMLGMSAKLEDDLMHVEIRLMQNLQEAMDDFKSRIDEINKTMDEETNKYFEDLEKFFSAYRDELLDHVKKVVDEFQVKMEDEGENEDEDVMFGVTNFQEMMNFAADADQIGQIFDNMKESNEQKLSDRQNQITKMRNDAWNNEYTELKSSQHNRNRNIVQEIMISRGKFDDKLSKLLILQRLIFLNYMSTT